jgi:hypothetical protein
MFEILQMTDKGLVSKKIAPQSHFTKVAREAFRHFEGVPYTGFRAVSGLDIRSYKTWNQYAEAVWAKATKSKG